MSARYRVREKLAQVDRFETHDRTDFNRLDEDTIRKEKAKRKARTEGKIDARRFDVNDAA